MIGTVNKVMIIGNLGRDPEIRHSQDGTKIVTLSVATSESWKDRSSGERLERTEWHRVVIFNPNLADIAERYLRKGSKAYLEGVLQTRKWTDQSGIERYTTEIVIGRFRGELAILDSRSSSSTGINTELQSLSYGSVVEYGSSNTTDYISTVESREKLKEVNSDNNSTKRLNYSPDLDDEIPF